MLRKFTLSATVLLVLATLWGMHSLHVSNPEFAPGSQNHHGGVQIAPPALRAKDGLPEFLPAEARTLVRLIQQGGPFPYRKDGIIFGNREKRLPARPYGYYREYTVETPGSHDRGARRIVTGGDPQRSGTTVTITTRASAASTYQRDE